MHPTYASRKTRQDEVHSAEICANAIKLAVTKVPKEVKGNKKKYVEFCDASVNSEI